MTLITSIALLAALNVYAAGLVCARSRMFRVPLYRPMLLNIGLSVLPVLIAAAIPLVALLAGGLIIERGGLPVLAALVLVLGLVVVTLAWLLLFPNSVYLITELNFSHRRAQDPVPLWFDIIATLTLTMSGVFNGIASLAIIQLLVEVVVDPNRDSPTAAPSSWVFVAAAIVLGSFGVYLGRYIRLNSWDVKHPVGLLQKVTHHFASRANLQTAVVFVATYSCFFGLLYALVTIPLRASLF